MPPGRMGNMHIALPWGAEGSMQEVSLGRHTLGTCGHSMSMHFRDGAERWENEVVLIGAALFSSTPKIHQEGEAKIPVLHQGKGNKAMAVPQLPWRCSAWGQWGKPCEGREPLRVDLSQLPPPRTSTKGGLLQQQIKQTQEKRSVPFIVICCRPCKTPALLTASLTSRNLSHTTLLLFQLHCVFVSLSLFFFPPFLFFFSFSCLQFASSGLFTIWLLWFLI